MSQKKQCLFLCRHLGKGRMGVGKKGGWGVGISYGKGDSFELRR